MHSVGWLMWFEARFSKHLKADFDLERKVSKPSRRMLCAFFLDKPVANPQNFENLSADLACGRRFLGGWEQSLQQRSICGYGRRQSLASTTLKKAVKGSSYY
jgi:hypothetical protein